MSLFFTVLSSSKKLKPLLKKIIIEKNNPQTDMFMSLKPSNMISMQFLTMTVDLIIKVPVDPSSRK